VAEEESNREMTVESHAERKMQAASEEIGPMKENNILRKTCFLLAESMGRAEGGGMKEEERHWRYAEAGYTQNEAHRKTLKNAF